MRGMRQTDGTIRIIYDCERCGRKDVPKDEMATDHSCRSCLDDDCEDCGGRFVRGSHYCFGS